MLKSIKPTSVLAGVEPPQLSHAVGRGKTEKPRVRCGHLTVAHR